MNILAHNWKKLLALGSTLLLVFGVVFWSASDIVYAAGNSSESNLNFFEGLTSRVRSFNPITPPPALDESARYASLRNLPARQPQPIQNHPETNLGIQSGLAQLGSSIATFFNLGSNASKQKLSPDEALRIRTKNANAPPVVLTAGAGEFRVNGSVSITGNLLMPAQHIELGGGTITASNLLYGLTAGNGISITGGQQAVIAGTQWKNAGPILTPIDPTASLAIGTTTASESITTAGGIFVGGVGTSTIRNSLTLGGNLEMSLSSILFGPKLIKFRATSTSEYAGPETVVLANNTATAFVFATSTQSSPLLNLATKNGGSVGIGTSSGEAFLTVNQRGNSRQSLFVGANGAPSLVVNAGGLVGVGTRNPEFTLDVVGTFRVTGEATFVTAPILTPLKNCAGSVLLGTDGAGRIICSDVQTVIRRGLPPAGQPGQVQFNSGGSFGGASSLVWDDGNRFLGVGTSTPVQTLSVTGSGYITGGFGVGNATTTSGVLETSGIAFIGGVLKVTGSATSTFANGLSIAAGGFNFALPSCNTTSALTTDASGGVVCGSVAGGGSISAGTANRLTYYTGANTLGSANFLTVDTTNNLLGIATTTPAQKLSVNGRLQFDSPEIRYASSSASALTFKYFKAATSTLPNLTSAFTFATSTTNTPLFTLSTKSSRYGMVGIGTSTPAALLSINAVNSPTNAEGFFLVGSSTATNFIVDNHGFVGVGTGNPATKLTVQVANGISAIEATDGTARLVIQPASSGQANYIGTLGAHDLAIGTNNTDRLYIQNTGTLTFNNSSTAGASTFNVNGSAAIGDATWIATAAPANGLTIKGNLGIGTTTPAQKLSVNGRLQFDSPEIRYASSSAAAFTLKYFKEATSTVLGNAGAFNIATSTNAAQKPIFSINGVNGSFRVRGAGTSTIDNGLTVAGSGLASSKGLVVSGGNTLITSGNVGIATTTPGGRLAVNGVSFFDSKLIRFASSSAALLTLQYNASATSTLKNLTTAFTFATSTTNTPIFSISTKSSRQGLVGIGTTSPAAALAINAPGNIPGLLIGSSTITNFIVDKNGNVGIGTGNPTASLDIGGNLTIAGVSGTITTNGHILAGGELRAGATYSVYWSGRTVMQSPADGQVTFLNNAQSDFGRLNLGGTTASFPALARSGVNVVVELADGTMGANLGIATTTPGGRLAVNGVSFFDSKLIRFASSSAALLTLQYNAAATSTLPNLTSAFRFATSTTNTPLLTLSTKSSRYGMVGIGTSTPAALLSINAVNSPTNAEGFFLVGSSTATNFIVDNHGFVGVGTGVPTSKLEVAGNIALGSNQIKWGTSGSEDVGFARTSAGKVAASNGGTGLASEFIANGIGLYDGTIASPGNRNIYFGLNSDWYLGFSSISSIKFSTTADGAGSADLGLKRGAAGKLYVGNGTSGDYTGTIITGNVGIGTTTPGATFAVNGRAFFDSPLIRFASSSASTLTLQYSTYATSTLLKNAAGSWSLATTTAAGAKPILSFTKEGGLIDYLNATSTFAGGLSVAGGGLASSHGLIVSGGNVGIGTAGPVARLDIIGSQNFTAFTAPGALTAGTPTAGGSCTAGTHSYKVTFTSVGGGETTGGTGSNQITCVSVSGQTVSLSTIPTGPAGTVGRKIYRTATGDVGSYLLLTTIADNTTTTYSDTTADGSLGAAAPSSNTTAAANLQIGGTTRMVIDSTGNLGIATTTPGARFALNGPAFFDSKLIRFASSSAALLTLQYNAAATSTVANSSGSFSLATTTAAGTKPIFSITKAGGLVDYINATSTLYGGLSATTLAASKGIQLTGGVLNSSVLFKNTASATSSFSGGVTVDALTLGHIRGCNTANTIKTDSSGSFICATDAGGSGSPNLIYRLIGATKYYTASSSATDNNKWHFQSGFVSSGASSTVAGFLRITNGLEASSTVRVSSHTIPQLLLSDYNGASGKKHWVMRTDANGDLSFATSSDALATSTPVAMKLFNSGVGLFVGTTTNNNATGIASFGRVFMASITSSNTGDYVCYNTVTLEIEQNATACSLSSIRWKENIREIDGGLDKILKLHPILYDLKPKYGTAKNQPGFIAEEAVKTTPFLVSMDEEGKPSGYDYPKLTAYLVQAIKDIWGKITNHEGRIKKLERENAGLLRRIELLETKGAGASNTAPEPPPAESPAASADTSSSTAPVFVPEPDSPDASPSGLSAPSPSEEPTSPPTGTEPAPSTPADVSAGEASPTPEPTPSTDSASHSDSEESSDSKSSPPAAPAEATSP